MRNHVTIIFLAFSVFFVSCKKESVTDPTVVVDPPIPVPGDDDHLLPGNPTNADADINFPDNYFINQIYYKEAYSNSRGIPVWVSWHMQSEDWGSAARQDDFRSDPKLPASFYKVQSTSYTNSGFDRGHNCPSADRTSSVPANSSTFFMTNMTPQAPNLNRGPWAGLEDYIRASLVGSSNEAWIIMGSTGRGGTGSSGTVQTINNGKITVPARIWKVVLIIPKGVNDLARIDSSAKILVVDMPNVNTYTSSSTGSQAWRNYITTVTTVEQEAHVDGVNLNLFSNLGASVRSYLKTKRFQ